MKIFFVAACAFFVAWLVAFVVVKLCLKRLAETNIRQMKAAGGLSPRDLEIAAEKRKTSAGAQEHDLHRTLNDAHQAIKRLGRVGEQVKDRTKK